MVTGGFGGGGRGGGSLVGRGDVTTLDSTFEVLSSCSSSGSLALGIISDRYSRSSADKARELW